MKLPQRVKVGGFWYSIEPATEELNIRQQYGHTEHYTCTIKVDPELSKERVKETLLHEVLHTIDAAFPPDDQMTELQIKVAARLLFQVFTDNPEVRKFIFEDD